MNKIIPKILLLWSVSFITLFILPLNIKASTNISLNSITVSSSYKYNNGTFYSDSNSPNISFKITSDENPTSCKIRYKEDSYTGEDSFFVDGTLNHISGETYSCSFSATLETDSGHTLIIFIYSDTGTLISNYGLANLYIDQNPPQASAEVEIKSSYTSSANPQDNRYRFNLTSKTYNEHSYDLKQYYNATYYYRKNGGSWKKIQQESIGSNALNTRLEVGKDDLGTYDFYVVLADYFGNVSSKSPKIEATFDFNEDYYPDSDPTAKPTKKVSDPTPTEPIINSTIKAQPNIPTNTQVENESGTPTPEPSQREDKQPTNSIEITSYPNREKSDQEEPTINTPFNDNKNKNSSRLLTTFIVSFIAISTVVSIIIFKPELTKKIYSQIINKLNIKQKNNE